MTFNQVYKEMKERRLLRGAKKDDIRLVYDLLKQKQELQRECDKKKSVLHEQVINSDFYIMNSVPYCCFLEIVNERELE